MYVEELGIDETHSLYQFLPLAHVLARVAQAVVISAGARDLLLERRRQAGSSTSWPSSQPTHFPAVPRIYEKIHGTVVGTDRGRLRAPAGAVSAGRCVAALGSRACGRGTGGR